MGRSTSIVARVRKYWTVSSDNQKESCPDLDLRGFDCGIPLSMISPLACSRFDVRVALVILLSCTTLILILLSKLDTISFKVLKLRT